MRWAWCCLAIAMAARGLRPELLHAGYTPAPLVVEPAPAGVAPATYSCDGRTRCSQMHSCAEATWMLNHCTGMQVDGNRDGVPCERQCCTGAH